MFLQSLWHDATKRADVSIVCVCVYNDFGIMEDALAQTKP